MRSWIPTLGSLEVICRRRRIQENQENQEMRMGRKKEVENLKRKRERK